MRSGDPSVPAAFLTTRRQIVARRAPGRLGCDALPCWPIGAFCAPASRVPRVARAEGPAERSPVTLQGEGACPLETTRRMAGGGRRTCPCSTPGLLRPRRQNSPSNGTDVTCELPGRFLD